MLRFTFLVLALSFTLVSCKKNYTCSCVQTVTTTAYTQYGTYYPQKTTANTFKNFLKNTEDKAESACKNFENFRMDNYGSGESYRTTTESTECELL